MSEEFKNYITQAGIDLDSMTEESKRTWFKDFKIYEQSKNAAPSGTNVLPTGKNLKCIFSSIYILP